MSMLPLILGPRELEGVRDVLRDWSAAGLVDHFVWTDGVAATVVDAGRATRLPLRRVLTATRADEVVLTVLGAALRGVTPVPRDRVSACESIIDESLGQGMSVTRIRATAVLKGVDLAVPTLATAGWHNVVLAAEEGSIPERGRIVLDHTTHADDVMTHIAASLAGVLGLWAGVDTMLFGSASAPQSPAARLTRSFVRSLDSTRVESELRTAVLTTDSGLPLPRVSGGSEYIEDDALATSSMSDSYWRVFDWVLRGPREQPAMTEVKKVGALEALGMFFSFLVAAVRNAPGRWVASVFRKIKAGAASRVQGAVFGTSDSAYVVVVGGVLPDGRPASWQDLGDAVDTLAAGVTNTAHVPHEDLTQLWQAYAAAALTLCDAGERNPAFPPVEIGARKGVLRRREDAVPDASTRFTEVPPHLAAVVGAAEIAPYDTLEADDLEQRLAALASQPGAGVAASTALEELRRWRRKFATSFSVRIGSRLGEALTTVRAEVAGILERLREGAGDDVDDRLARSQRKLARALRILFIVFAVLLALVGILLGFAVVGAALGWSLIGGLLLAWFVSSFVLFIRGQATLFRLMRERRELLSRREADEANLRHALRDMRRLVDAYTQFLRWSEVLGVVLADPFGSSSREASSSTPGLAGLPLSVVVGEAQTDAAALDIVAAELRRLAFEPGWLNAVFGTVMRNAHRRLGGRGIEFREAPDLLFRQLGEGDQSVLPTLTAHLARHGVDPDAGDRRWAGSLGLLAEHPSLSEQLLQRVDSAGASVAYGEFMGALERSAGGSHQGIEDSSLRPDVRIQAGKTAIATSEPVTVTRGLSRLVLLRQATVGLPAFEFTVHGETASGSTGGDWATETDTPVL